MTEEQLKKERAGFDAAWPGISKHGDAHGWEGVGWAAWQARAQAPIEVTFRADTSVLQAALQAYTVPAGYRAPRHRAMVDFHQHQERLYVVLEEDHEKVEKERDQLRAEVQRRDMRIKELDLLFGRYILAMRSAVIEMDHGAGAQSAMAWIVNSLFGPGELPPEDETDAQAYFDREIKPVDEGLQEIMRFWEADRAAKQQEGGA